MSSCRLIVCEKSSHWAAALRLALGGRLPQVVETRSLAGCEAALAASPFSLAALETTATNIETVLDFLQTRVVEFPRCSVAALLVPELPSASQLLREAGAIAVVSSVVEAPGIARLAQRQFALAPPPEISLRDLVAAQMPWPAFANS